MTAIHQFLAEEETAFTRGNRNGTICIAKMQDGLFI